MEIKGKAFSDKEAAGEAILAVCKLASSKDVELGHYARIRKAFEAYRQAGYSKKFAAEHREELEAYREAKRAFQKIGQAKIPSGRELQVAFEQTLVEKRDAYAAYWAKQREWREMMVVKGNVEQILKAHEQQDKTKAKETLR